MSSETVTGWTKSKIERERADWNKRHPDRPFKENHCLAEIPRQPPDYDGPVRYCALQKWLTELKDGTTRCKFHSGNPQNDGNPEKLEPLAAMKHGMKATRAHLVEDFDEKDQALYDWIMDEWPEAYGIDFETDPQARYDFHRLAAEVVRAERGRGFILQEGEVHEQDRYSDDGALIVSNETGEVVTEKSEHYLAQMLHRQDKKITDLEKELGLTRKERLRQDSKDDAVEAMKNFMELGSSFLDRESNDYDPDDEPWNYNGEE